MLHGLPSRYGLPIVVGHHLGGTAGALAALLRRHTPLTVEEAIDKAAITPGSVFVAPAGYHLLVERGHLALSIEGPVRHARPSIDVLFESAADAYARGVVAVVLTGAGRDGAAGAAAVKRRGGTVIVQDPVEAACAILPRAALSATAVDRVLPLTGIATYLATLAEPAQRPTDGC
jgi:two-component system chemotaxis response regulator CheB